MDRMLVCSTSKFMCSSPKSQCSFIWSKEVKLNEVVRVGSDPIGLVFTRSDTRGLMLEPPSCPSPWASASRTRNKFLLSPLPHQVMYFVMAAQAES